MNSDQSRQLHQGGPILTAGKPLESASAAMILVHGRGSSAENILELSGHLYHPEVAYLAPQAAGNTWYPFTFLSPLEKNEPHLSSALQVVADLIEKVETAGIPANRTVLCGFSQGACLASEFAVRNPRRYGGVLAFSGGVIGPLGEKRDDAGDLGGTPVFLGCSDVDFHIPVERVHETAEIFSRLGAEVTKLIVPGMGHTIIRDEIEQAEKILGSLFSG